MEIFTLVTGVIYVVLEIRQKNFMWIVGMANALAAITAQNIGAGKPKRARQALWYGLGFALVVSFLFWVWV